jgi:ribosomal protein S6
MKHYELVLIFGAATSLDAINQARNNIESVISEIIQIDDIWMLPLVSPLLGHNTAYFVSYYIKSDTAWLQAIKQQIRITREIIKHHIFAMNESDIFIMYKDINISYNKLVERDIPKKFNSQKNSLENTSVIADETQDTMSDISTDDVSQ